MVVASSKLFPRDMVMSFTSPTKRALYYEENLTEEMDDKNRLLDARGKILIIKEEENAEEFMNEIKELLGHDDMVSKMPFCCRERRWSSRNSPPLDVRLALLCRRNH